MAYKIYEVQLPFAAQPAVIVVTAWQASIAWRIDSFLLVPGASEFHRCAHFEVGKKTFEEYNALVGHAEPSLTVDENFAEAEALRQAMSRLLADLEGKYGTAGILNVGELRPSLSGLRVFVSLLQHPDGRAILAKLKTAAEDVELGSLLQQFCALRPFSRGAPGFAP